jgi:hypothetical protein
VRIAFVSLSALLLGFIACSDETPGTSGDAGPGDGGAPNTADEKREADIGAGDADRSDTRDESPNFDAGSGDEQVDASTDAHDDDSIDAWTDASNGNPDRQAIADVQDAAADAIDSSSPDAIEADASGDGGPACDGPVLEGSFVIHNTIDVMSVTPYARITGNLIISAPGLTTVSLPNLCAVDGVLSTDVTSMDLATLDLPALASTGSFAVLNTPLHTVHLDELRRVARDFNIESDDVLSLPAFESAAAIYIWNSTHVDMPELTTVGDSVGPGNLNVALSSTNPTTDATAAANKLLSAGQVTVTGTTLTAHALTTVSALFVNPASGVDVPALKSITGQMWYKSGLGSGAFAALSTIGGDVTIDSSASSMTFPVLSSIGGNATIQVNGSFSAPALVRVNGALSFQNVSSFDLTSLESVGAPDWQTALRFDGLGTTSVHFPSLTSACMFIGSPSLNCTGGNLAMLTIDAPQFTQGGVQFFNDPVLPMCRADALAAGIANPVPYSAPGFTHCPLAAGPCP